MNQLIQPNLAVIGYPDYCLAYVEQVFGVKNDPDPNAWQGWLHTKYKHTDALPPNSVPVWFSWTGTIGGIYQNWGHVAVSTPGGVYTNPLSGSGHKVFPSISALASAYGVTYVGWSEDLGNLRIVQGVSMIEPQTIISTFADFDAGVPTAAQISYYGNHPGGYTELYLDLLKYNHDARMALVSSAGYVAYSGPPLFVKK